MPRCPTKPTDREDEFKKCWLLERPCAEETKDRHVDTTSRPRSLLLSLPPEIRNIIYHLVVYHVSRQGLIAPIPATLTSGTQYDPVPKDTRARSLQILHNHYRLDYTNAYLNQHTPHGPRTHNRTWTEYACGHICTQACLLQPPLAKVNRQLRTEVLSYVYGANTFRFIGGGVYNGLEAMFVKWVQGIGDANIRLVERIEILRCYADAIQRSGLFSVVDGLTIERAAGRERRVVTCSEAFLTSPPLPIGEHWVCKGKGWQRIRGWYIAEAFRKDIEGLNGLSVRSLEMVLRERRWIPPSVRPYTVVEEDFQAAELAFMTGHRGRKATKVRMLAEGEVGLGVDDMLASVEFVQRHARASLGSHGDCQVSGYD